MELSDSNDVRREVREQLKKTSGEVVEFAIEQINLRNEIDSSKNQQLQAIREQSEQKMRAIEELNRLREQRLNEYQKQLDEAMATNDRPLIASILEKMKDV
jgi:hypothetical protein